MLFSSSPQHSDHTLSQAAEVGLLVLLCAGLFFLFPPTLNFLTYSKLLVLLVGGSLSLALWFSLIISRRALPLLTHPIAICLLLFGLSTAAATFLTQPYPVENLLGLGGAYLGFALIGLVGGLLLPSTSSQRLPLFIALSSIALAVLAVFQHFGLGLSWLINVAAGYNIAHNGTFSILGSPFMAAQVFAILAITLGVARWKELSKSPVMALGLVAALVGLGFSLFMIWPGQPATPLLLPFGLSWTIALDVIKDFRSFLIGIGPESYGGAFTHFKPIWVNSMPWWSVTFTQAANTPLTLIVTHGIFGLVSWLCLALTIAWFARKAPADALPAVVLTTATLLVQLLVPNNMVLLIIQAVGIAAWLAAERTKDRVLELQFFKLHHPFRLDWGAQTQDTSFKVLSVLVGVIVTLGLFYLIGRSYLASYYAFKATLTAQANDVVGTYQNQQRSVLLNRYLAYYRSRYALTNLGIATALANKSDATADEKTQIAGLVKQAIREARATTVLRPDLSSSWQTLSSIYKNLIGSVESADQWTITTLVTAIKAEPTNPQLRNELGIIFFQQKQFAQASSLFQQAAELKPDLAVSYYNWANALKQLSQLSAAQAAYQKVQQLAPADAEIHIKATAELTEVEKVLSANAAKNPSTTGQVVKPGQLIPPPPTGTTANPSATPSPSPALPSVVNQTINQSDQEVVSQPGATPLAP